MELVPGAVAGVNQPLLVQPFQVFGIDGAPMALKVRRPAGAAAPVPVQAQPAEICLDLLRILCLAALRVQILLA